MRTNLNFELEFWERKTLIAGLDEVGVGALAGPIVVAGVIFPTWFQDCRIQDSKTLSSQKRQEVYLLIKEKALDIQTIVLNVSTIEKNNPLETTKKGMKEVMNSFKLKPDLYLIDGNLKIKGDSTLNLVKGDSKSVSIAAASIVAKVTRDRIMQKYHSFFPTYNWYKNKGYFDKKHLIALLKHGFCRFHRRTYEPIKSLFEGKNVEELKSKYSKFVD